MRCGIALVLVVAALAGCADPETSEPEEFSNELDQDLEATETTGVIRGVVVDQAIVPLEGILVKLKGAERETSTNADGAFGFDKLDPGPYFMMISSPGYVSIQQSVDVVAGEDRPPIVRVVLQPDASFLPPRYELITYEGFYQCGTSFLVVCGIPNIFLGQGTTDDTSTPTIYFPGGEQFVQTEMIWESTQALSPELYFEMEALESGCDGDRSFLANAEGESPIRTRVNATVLEEAAIHPEDCGIYYSVFAGDTTNGVVPPWGVGFSIEQDFTWFITSFYGYEPPEEWWFVTDGEYPPPA